MPELHKSRNTVEVTLPSYGTGDDKAVVVMSTTITVEDAISVDDSLNDRQKAVAVVTQAVKSWNLTEDGKPLAVTRENVARLPINDFYALIQALNLDGMSGLGLEKKSS